MNLKYSFIFLILLLTNQIFPQTKIPFENKNWKWLTPVNNKIYSIAIDEDTIWAGSDVGFFKVNVSTGERVNYNKINSPLPDNWILSIAVDNAHNKWIGTHEKGVIKVQGDDWQIFDPKYFGIYRMEIRDMKVENDFLWIATWGDGLIKMNIVNNSFKIFTPENSGLLYNAIFDIEIDENGNKWIATMLGICKFDNTTWTPISNAGEDFEQMINSISIDKAGNVWALYENSSISTFDGTNWKSYKIPDSLFWCGFTDPSSMYVDQKDNIWIGTLDGLVKFDRKNWMLMDEGNTGFDIHMVKCIVPDKNNRIWIGSWAGLFSLENDVLKNFSTGNSLINMSIHSIKIDKNGKVWIGTSSGLSSFYNGEWIAYTKSNSGLPANYIYKIAIDSTNNKWLSVLLCGLVKYNDNENNWYVYDTLNSCLPDNFVTDLEVDENNLLWTSTKKGLASFDGTNWRIFNQSNSGIPLKGVSELAFDTDNNLWVVASNFDLKNRDDKIVKFDGDRFININPPESFNKLNKTSIYGFVIDNRNVKWISTSDNLIWNDDKTWNFMDKYLTQIFFGCLGDIYCDDNFTWICSSMGGLIRYNGSKFMVWNNDNSFLPDDIITVNKDNYGNLWIGTQNQGIIIYNPKGIIYDEETN